MACQGELPYRLVGMLGRIPILIGQLAVKKMHSANPTFLAVNKETSGWTRLRQLIGKVPRVMMLMTLTSVQCCKGKGLCANTS